MTQAENQIIEVFCREFALALRRITGRQIKVSPESLPDPIKPIEGTSAETKNEVKSDESAGEK